MKFKAAMVELLLEQTEDSPARRHLEDLWAEIVRRELHGEHPDTCVCEWCMAWREAELSDRMSWELP